MRRFGIFLSALLLFSTSILSGKSDEIRFSPQDEEIFAEVMSFAIPKRGLEMPDLVTSIALHFLETPYTAATLEQEPEMLTINLHETDCILFVEMCVALAHIVKSFDNPTFEDYCSQIRKMRYRDGVVAGYSSRIHYTSEWIIQNEKNSLMSEFSRDYNIPLNMSFSYMSTHPKSYKQLAYSDDMVRKISMVERNLDKQAPYYYIPNEKLREIQGDIRNGDIICFVSTVKGLDISHVALAYWIDERLHFIHASFKEKKVVVEKKTLVEYAKSGIRVVRLK